jgi:hypothetical protein
MDDEITKTCDELKQILLKKNHDYGNSFGETFTELGAISGLTRFIDKVNRIKQLTLNNGQEVIDESLLDTWLDAAGYALLNYIELKKQEKNYEINKKRCNQI